MPTDLKLISILKFHLPHCCMCCTTVNTDIMHISLNHHSGDPLYRQVVEAIRLRIAKGEIEAGEQLPSIRDLAAQLQINSRTVVKAYEELDRAGLVVMQQGRGVFVASNRAALPVSERRKRLRELAVKLLVEATQVGSNVDEVIEIIHDVAKELETKK
jgi:GntR family transcriptional regulator